jgi:WD40 repeat protein
MSSPTKTQEFSGGKYGTTALRFSSTGRLLGATNEDGGVRVWDVLNGTARFERHFNDYEATALAFSPDEKLLAVGSCDTKIRLLNANSGDLITTLITHYSPIYGLHFLGEYPHLLASHACDPVDRRICLWDLNAYLIGGENSLEPLILEGHTDAVNEIEFVENGQILLSVSGDGTAQVWNLGSLECATITDGWHSSTMALSSDQKVLALSGDNEIRLYRVPEMTLTATLKGHSDRVWCLAFSDDDKRLASGSYDKTVTMWDVETGKLLQNYAGHRSGVATVQFVPSSYEIVSAGFHTDKSVYLWGDHNYILEANAAEAKTDLTPNGKTLGVGGCFGGTISLWNVHSNDVK